MAKKKKKNVWQSMLEKYKPTKMTRKALGVRAAKNIKETKKKKKGLFGL